MAGYLPYLFLLRAPFTIALLTAILGPLAVLDTSAVIDNSLFRPMFRGMFALDRWGVFWVVFLALNLWLTMIRLSLTIAGYAPQRFRVAPLQPQDRVERWFRNGYGACVLVLLALVLVSAEVHGWGLVLPVGAALLLFTLVAYSPPDAVSAAGKAFLVYLYRIGRRRSHAKGLIGFLLRWTLAIPFRVLLWAARISPDGFFVNGRSGGCLLRGHWLGVGLVLVQGVVYGIVFAIKWTVLQGQSEPAQPLGFSFPTLASLLLLFSLLCWVASGVTFYLDRFRFPFLGFAVAVLWAANFSPYKDYYFEVTERPAPPALSAAQLLKGDNPVVVCAEGGGIQAGAWAARVLTELEKQSKGALVSNLRAMSGVSGGSVGLMYWAAAYGADGRMSEASREGVYPKMTADSLDNVAFGLVGPDFVRLAFPFLFHNRDRGWALEQTWAQRLGGRPTLDDWRGDARAGHKPAMMFNTTVVETGDRLVFANFDFEVPKEDDPRPKRLDQLTGKTFNLAVPTAVRLSASFPFVTPVAQPDAKLPKHQRFHLADGGYHDNSGVLTMVEFLRQALKGRRDPKRVLLVEIRSKTRSTEVSSSGGEGAFFQVLAPLGALAKVRDRQETSRNDVETDFLDQDMESQGIKLVRVLFQSPRKEKDAPLSWHLTHEDLRTIEEDWMGHFDEQVKQVVEFVNGR